MNPVDLDRLDTWPVEITDFLATHSAALRVERIADREYTLSPSTHRITNDAPPMLTWTDAKELVKQVMADRDLLVFHATRLIDFDHIRNDGLFKLDLKQHVDRIKGHLESDGALEELAEVDAAVKKMLDADPSFINREGAVWATPNRKSLHDGGCDVFYETYGGEAIERITAHASDKLVGRLRQMGTPAVVIFRYPAYGEGWCASTAHRLPQTMIELFLQSEGNWEACDYGWDVMIKRDLPAANIVAVVKLDNPEVAA